MLHGEIHVNQAPIARWVARRIDPLKGHDEEHIYKATYQNLETGEVTIFPMTHRYSDGAAVLLQKLLEEVNLRHKADVTRQAEQVLLNQRSGQSWAG